MGPPQALPVVHDTARHEHAGRGRRRVRRARALPHDVRPGQAAQRSRDPPLSLGVTRRDLLKLLAIAAASGIDPRRLEADDGPERPLAFDPFGTVTLLPLTDAPATPRPVFYREPDTLIGVGDERGKPPFLTGAEFLGAYHLAADSAAAYAYTSLDFPALAARYGRMGGYAHLATLVKRVRAERPGRTLLLDGGDTIQGSAPALWTRGEDMVRVSNELGVDVLTAHWEFVYGIDRVRELFGDRARTGLFAGDFVAHNVRELGWNDRVFRPYTIRQVGGVSVGVIGQAFPYTPVSHPRRFVPDLTFGIREDGVQALVNELRDEKKVDLVVLLSHNGVAVDLKLAGRVQGLDVVLGGHTHDALPQPILDALLRRADAQIAFSPGFRWGITIVPGQEITLEDVYAHTALTYPNTWVREMTGREIHQLMEDVADNLFHPDPYYRQGGDMVRLGGLTYAIDPAQALGRRISDIRIGAQPLEPARRYKTAGWASVATEADGPPAWDVGADHLRRLGRIRLDPRPRVRVV